MTGPLSQRMPPSFCWSHMFAESCLEVLRLDPEQWVWHFGPSFELELCRLSPCLLGRWKRWAGPICHSVLSPSSRRRNFLKKLPEFSSSLLDFLAGGGGHTNSIAGIPIPLSSSVALSFWPLASLYHTAVYYFNQYPPFPLLSLPLSLSLSPLNPFNTLHTHFLRPAWA